MIHGCGSSKPLYLPHERASTYSWSTVLTELKHALWKLVSALRTGQYQDLEEACLSGLFTVSSFACAALSDNHGYLGIKYQLKFTAQKAKLSHN